MRATVEKAKGVQEDDLLGRAIEVVKLQRRASISLLQRKLQIGYTRAARLIDLMEQKGVVGPAMKAHAGAKCSSLALRRVQHQAMKSFDDRRVR